MAGVRVVVFESTIHRMFQPGGMVYDEASSAAREVAFLARLDAPSRTGELAGSIRVASERRASRTTVGFYVRADAPYAYFVHEGTSDIYSEDMSVPKYPEWGARGWSPRVIRDEVSGQASQPFLRINLEYVMSRVS